MDVPKKIRLLNRVGKVFPAWAIKRQALIIERAFDDDLAKAKDEEARHYVLQQMDFEAREYWNKLSEIRSRKLVNQAQKYIAVDDVVWHSDEYANRYLDNATQVKLRRLILEERHKDWEFRLKVVAALTGLFGTLIGLLAFLEKFLPHKPH